MSSFKQFFTGWRPSSSLVYLVTFVLFAGLIGHFQVMNQNETCGARNELRGQILTIQTFDVALADELKDYLILRLSGDKGKIAEGVGPLKETIRDIDGLKTVPLMFEDC